MDLSLIILISFALSAGVTALSLALWVRTRRLQEELGAVRAGAICFGRRQLRAERVLQQLLAQPQRQTTVARRMSAVV